VPVRATRLGRGGPFRAYSKVKSVFTLARAILHTMRFRPRPRWSRTSINFLTGVRLRLSSVAILQFDYFRSVSADRPSGGCNLSSLLWFLYIPVVRVEEPPWGRPNLRNPSPRCITSATIRSPLSSVPLKS
jgi:hypothetical protein